MRLIVTSVVRGAFIDTIRTESLYENVPTPIPSVDRAPTGSKDCGCRALKAAVGALNIQSRRMGYRESASEASCLPGTIGEDSVSIIKPLSLSVCIFTVHAKRSVCVWQLTTKQLLTTLV